MSFLKAPSGEELVSFYCGVVLVLLVTLLCVIAVPVGARVNLPGDSDGSQTRLPADSSGEHLLLDFQTLFLDSNSVDIRGGGQKSVYILYSKDPRKF